MNPVQPVANGQTVSVDVEHEGKPRRYLLRIPDNYNPDDAAPALFGFGGWEDSPENFSSYARMWNTGAHGEAIIVYPEGYERAWEAAPYAKTRDGEDIRFIKRILDDIDLDYRVDRSRVYAMGMSNGGGFTSVLGCHAQDTFAAVAMVSGAFYNPVEMNCVDAPPMSTLIMHGTADKMMTYDGGTRHEAGYLPVRTVLGGYLNRNRCDMTFMSEPAASGSERLNFNGCQQPVELLKVPADHTWFWLPMPPTRCGTSSPISTSTSSRLPRRRCSSYCLVHPRNHCCVRGLFFLFWLLRTACDKEKQADSEDEESAAEACEHACPEVGDVARSAYWSDLGRANGGVALGGFRWSLGFLARSWGGCGFLGGLGSRRRGSLDLRRSAIISILWA